MLITVACPSCGRRYDVAGKLAGRKVRCKECATQFRMPVPQTLPKEAQRERRPNASVPSLENEVLDEVLGSDNGVADESSRSTLQAVGLLPDWGETWTYRIIQIAIVAIFVAAWFFHIGSPLGITIWLSWIVGGFLLLPILAGWPSFEETRRARLIGRFAGLDFARATQATVAMALWISAILIALGAIQIVALEPWPAPDPPAAANPDKAPELPSP